MAPAVTIQAEHPNYSKIGPPPGFTITTPAAYPYLEIQVASDPFLFNEAAARRRTPRGFFDSWAVSGPRLQAVRGRARFTLPRSSWRRLRSSATLYYRAIGHANDRNGRTLASTASVDWRRSPSFAVGRLPASAPRSAPARFGGRGSLKRTDFFNAARANIDAGTTGFVSGNDGDFYFAVLDDDRFDLTVVQCHDLGLVDTVAAMHPPPVAVINGQFIGFSKTEGQTIREGILVNSDGKPDRFFVEQDWSRSAAPLAMGKGDPDAVKPNARAAFGGLGPVLLGSAVVPTPTAWARSIYDRGADSGRGVMAVHRLLRLVLLMVQRDIGLFSSGAVNAMPLPAVRAWLQARGVDDAVFNDGSDSEALYVDGWALKPAWRKSTLMHFALGFTDRKRFSRLVSLVLDGTRTPDGDTIAQGLQLPLSTQYAPRNAVTAIPATFPAVTSTLQPPPADTARRVDLWQAETASQAGDLAAIFRSAGVPDAYADVFYVSTHAWRHGELWYVEGDPDPHGATKGHTRFTLANPWTGFRPGWRTSPKWLVLAGCAVLSLHYTRCLALDSAERGHLVAWQKDMYGASATVPGLTASMKTAWETFHPGCRWHRLLSGTGVRGVLGYWYRSPGAGDDVPIAADFVKNLVQGKTFLEAWEKANQRGFFEAQAAWAALIREEAQGDHLSDLEATGLPSGRGQFLYFDRYQTGAPIATAYGWANKTTGTRPVDGRTIHFHEDYDKTALSELKDLSPSGATLLVYNDGVTP